MIFRLPAVVVLFLLLAASAFAQELNGDGAAADKSNDRPAQELFEDANGYLGRRYQEFNKQNLPYDPRIEEKTKKEQKELALRNAGILRARPSLSNDDLYYLGMLYHLAEDADNTLSTMRRLIKDVPDGVQAQSARNVDRALLDQERIDCGRSYRCCRLHEAPAAEPGRPLSDGVSDRRRVSAS